MIHYFMTNFSHTSSKEMCLFFYVSTLNFSFKIELQYYIKFEIFYYVTTFFTFKKNVFILEDLCGWWKNKLYICDFVLKYMLKCGSYQCRCSPKMMWFFASTDLVDELMDFHVQAQARQTAWKKFIWQYYNIILLCEIILLEKKMFMELNYQKSFGFLLRRFEGSNTWTGCYSYLQLPWRSCLFFYLGGSLISKLY